jgi:hypothetical protein
MTDGEIVSKINMQLYVAIALQIMASCTERLDPLNTIRIEHLHKTAGLFTAHALRLLATHRGAAARWMDARLPEPIWAARLQ